MGQCCLSRTWAALGWEQDPKDPRGGSGSGLLFPEVMVCYAALRALAVSPTPLTVVPGHYPNGSTAADPIADQGLLRDSSSKPIESYNVLGWRRPQRSNPVLWAGLNKPHGWKGAELGSASPHSEHRSLGTIHPRFPAGHPQGTNLLFLGGTMCRFECRVEMQFIMHQGISAL